jgi:predicted acylesterase/phospholipase RssA
MKIDTLVLSGGSTKVPAYLGSFRALKENNIIDENLTGINHIISCSVGMLYALMILLKVSDNVIEYSIKFMDFTELIDINGIDINNLLFEFGLFSNEKVASIISTIVREKYSKNDMSMRELYELTNIKLTAKVVNHTKSCIEYISYENEPDISITKVLLMTTAIPLFFKPIKHNDCLYVDGGCAGGFATEIAGDNYIGIQLRGPWKTDDNKFLKELPIIDYIIRGQAISCQDSTIPDTRHIQIPLNVHFTDFSITKDKKQILIDKGYELTKEHIIKNKLTNDLFN